MDLPQPNYGQLPNVEVAWAGDAETGHLSVSILIGTLFGVTNSFSEQCAKELVDCDELCECDLHADTGDLMATFHVSAMDWQDFAHAVTKRVFLHVAENPGEWHKRHSADGIGRNSRDIARRVN